ncbi:MAG: polysaccharide deacetylase family protein [Anaerolineaceae bacterium]|nr:polysaccharide deacetylase family protein [Anaerolineaceae bacterium]
MFTKRSPWKLTLLTCLCLVIGLAGYQPARAEQAALPLAQAPNPGTDEKVQALAKAVNAWTETLQPTPEPTIPPRPNPDLGVFLTFDDGPDPKWTPQVLDLLTRYGAVATFYMIGRNATSFPELVLDLAEHGQYLGNHTYNHADLAKLGYSGFYAEVIDTTEAIEQALNGHPELLGQVTPCLRPPYGSVGGEVNNYAYRMGYAVSMWQLDTSDWASPDPAEILDNVVQNVAPNKVILMHDGGEYRTNTIEALGLVLHELTLEGYQFLPLCTAQGQAYTY